MNPFTDHTISKTNALCPVCQKAFTSKRDEKACSDACQRELLLGEQQLAAARKMSQEIQDLYYSYRLKEQIKGQRMNY